MGSIEGSPKAMKGRSQQPPMADPPYDWREGSWTVDCSCGVTFDDGEEMVSCDECGVWVHTRCSRYVRGEASFACHNCKAAASILRSASDPGPFPLPDDTEVARLLAELPTKTDHCSPPPPAGPPRRCLWKAIPLEDRVHVQGVPGGDPDLFGSLSSPVAITSQLWKCSGYVPKRFNFRYREFPRWEEVQEKIKTKEEDGDNPANTGANVLLSLSKEIKKVGENVSPMLSCIKKERNRLWTFGPGNGAKKMEEPGELKDQSGKKRAWSFTDKIAGYVPSVATNKFKFEKDSNPQVEEASIPASKNEDQEEILSESIYASHPQVMGFSDNPDSLPFDNCTGMSSDLQMKGSNRLGTKVNFEKLYQMETVKTENNPKTDVASRGAKEWSINEVSRRAIYCLKQPKDENKFEGHLAEASCHSVLDSGISKPVTVACGHKELLDEPFLSASTDAVTPSTNLDINKVKIKGTDDISTTDLNFSTLRTAGKLHAVGSRQPAQLLNKLSKNIEYQENKYSFPSHRHMSQDVRRNCHEIKGITSRTGEPKKLNNRVQNLSEHKGYLGNRHGSDSFEEARNSKYQVLNDLVPGEKNVALGVIGESSTSYLPVTSKPIVPDINTSSAASSKAGKSSHLTKQVRVKVITSTAAKKESSPTPAEDNMGEAKMLQKSLVGSVQMSKPAPCSLSKVLSASMPMELSASCNAATTLSDKELALRLHQELNSSHRVPHMRHAAGIQSIPASGVNVPHKLPSLSGRKDHHQATVFRRKNKEDTLRDDIHNSQELNNEGKRKGEKINLFSSSEASKQSNFMARRNDGSVTFCTLPGLIDESMSTDNHITYEKLHNAVSPHWHDLRKPNRKRYVYPSHLHPVHDCPRNRSEWGHLIDQSPKRDLSKKRRKVYSDMLTVESANERVRVKSWKEDNRVESQRENCPKGKRNARKHGCLELRGTGMRESRKWWS